MESCRKRFGSRCSKMAPEYKDFDNPFLALQKELELFFKILKRIIALFSILKMFIISRLKFI
jgi:hypothetical protein